MKKTIDMQLMRYINLFRKISGVGPKHCFIYNSTIIFVVPKHSVQRAIGENSNNLKKMSEIVQRKIKIVAAPNDIKDAEGFISTIVFPAQIKNIEIENNMLIINSAPQNKAMLIGREKRRLDEMKKIIKDYFGKEVKIA
jgi:NusA-like KH domain protein